MKLINYLDDLDLGEVEIGEEVLSGGEVGITIGPSNSGESVTRSSTLSAGDVGGGDAVERGDAASFAVALEGDVTGGGGECECADGGDCGDGDRTKFSAENGINTLTGELCNLGGQVVFKMSVYIFETFLSF